MKTKRSNFTPLIAVGFVAVIAYAIGLWFIHYNKPFAAERVSQINKNKEVLLSLKKDDFLVYCGGPGLLYQRIFPSSMDSYRDSQGGNIAVLNFSARRGYRNIDNLSQEEVEMLRVAKGDPHYISVLEAYAFRKEVPLEVCAK